MGGLLKQEGGSGKEDTPPEKREKKGALRLVCVSPVRVHVCRPPTTHSTPSPQPSPNPSEPSTKRPKRNPPPEPHGKGHYQP